MKRSFIILFFVLLSTPCLVSFQGQDLNARSRMQALYVYNFASRYIEWPSGYKDGNFIIGILGETPLMKEITTTTASKKVLNQSIEIKKFGSTSEITKCNILFIPHDKSESFQDVAGKLKNSSTLVITEKDGILKQGVSINFVSVDGKLKFELNKTAMQKQELKVASELERLAVQVM